MRKLLKTKLCCRHFIKGINPRAVPLVTYSKPFLKWTREELRQIDQRTRKMMALQKALHPGNDIDKHYLSRKRSRGIPNFKECVDASFQGLDEIKKRKERLITAVSDNTGNLRQHKKATKTRKQKRGDYGDFRRQTKERKPRRDNKRKPRRKKPNLFL